MQLMKVYGVKKSCKYMNQDQFNNIALSLYTDPSQCEHEGQGWGSPTGLAQVPAHPFSMQSGMCNKRSGVDGDMRLGVRGKVAAFAAAFRIWPHLFSIFAEMSFTIFTCFSHSNIAVFTLPSSYGKAVSSLTETMSISSSSSSSSCPCPAVCGPER